MKKLIIAALAFVPMLAIAQDVYQPPVPLCTTEISYVIRDSDGNVKDSTVYNRSWAIDCVTSVQLKYAFIRQSLTSGETGFTALTGQPPTR